jgi:hypothetical protein
VSLQQYNVTVTLTILKLRGAFGLAFGGRHQNRTACEKHQSEYERVDKNHRRIRSKSLLTNLIS